MGRATGRGVGEGAGRPGFQGRFAERLGWLQDEGNGSPPPRTDDTMRLRSPRQPSDSVSFPDRTDESESTSYEPRHGRHTAEHFPYRQSHTCAEMATKCRGYRHSDSRKRNPAAFTEEAEPKPPAACRCRSWRAACKTRGQGRRSPVQAPRGAGRGAGKLTGRTASSGPGHGAPGLSRVPPLCVLQDEASWRGTAKRKEIGANCWPPPQPPTPRGKWGGRPPNTGHHQLSGGAADAPGDGHTQSRPRVGDRCPRSGLFPSMRASGLIMLQARVQDH